MGYAVRAEPNKERLRLGKGYADASFGDNVEVADLDAPRVVRGMILKGIARWLEVRNSKISNQNKCNSFRSTPNERFIANYMQHPT